MAKIDMMLYEEIGHILKRERTSQKISLDILSEKINNLKTKSTLKRYEDGASRIDMDTLRLICKALCLNYADVIKEAEQKVDFYAKTNEDSEYQENTEYLSTHYPNLVDLYNEIYSNDQLVLLFDKARKLEPQDLAQILKIIDTFNNETK